MNVMQERGKSEFTSPFFKVRRGHEGMRRTTGRKSPPAPSSSYLCNACNKIYGQGDVSAVANDMVDGSTGHVFVCKACWLEKTRPEIRREGWGLPC